MNSFRINMRTSHGGLLLAGLLFFAGAAGSGDVLAQQYPATQPVTQTTGPVDLLATVQDDNSAEAAPTITSIDEG